MKPQLFTPRPIEATQWDGTSENAVEIIEWIESFGGEADYCDDYPDYRFMRFRNWGENNYLSMTPGNWVVRLPNEFIVLYTATFNKYYMPIGGEHND